MSSQGYSHRRGFATLRRLRARLSQSEGGRCTGHLLAKGGKKGVLLLGRAHRWLSIAQASGLPRRAWRGHSSTRTLQPTAQRVISSRNRWGWDDLSRALSGASSWRARGRDGVSSSLSNAQPSFTSPPLITCSGGVLREMCPVRRRPCACDSRATPSEARRRTHGSAPLLYSSSLFLFTRAP